MWFYISHRAFAQAIKHFFCYATDRLSWNDMTLQKVQALYNMLLSWC